MSWTEDNERENDGIYFEGNSFHFGERTLTDLDALARDLLTSGSREETICCAPTLLSFVVDEQKRGHNLCLETPEGIRRVVMSFLRPLE